MNNSLRAFALLFPVAIFFSSCGGSSSSEKAKAEADEVAFSEAEKKIVSDMDQVIHDLPSPTEVPYLLQATGADYNAELINSLEKLPQYQTNEDEAALNLGVYATDMGYLISYNKIEEATNYMESCQKLAESLGVASVFNVATIEKFQNNLNNADSLNKILSEAIIEAESKLENADRATMAALVLTGSFVEGLHLAVRVIETYPTDVLDEENRNLILEPMVKVVLDQKKPLLDVIAMLKDLPQDDIIAKMIAELNILRILYDGDLAEIEEKISENTGNFVLTQDMLLDITKEVKRVRRDIVEYK
ncbi:hypothetical protein [Marinoscillum furvescens]|uniref:Uncharacterized protein n=1 Tax=Marinoscillum furvescens DSM 4134 TaxID=1122208 RepID=A0A3D9L4T6_MARFU|nr:hypothetical protein [Marinoscillum furvescens]RED97940.1 hypothetical protein C7460_11181 [Marinoscillum furvescens DSM 4134]